MNEILSIILWTLTPLLELRWSIPHGILFTDVPWLLVAIIAAVTNIILGWAFYITLTVVVDRLRRWHWFDTLFTKLVERPRRRIHKAIEKWGELGVAIFIGIPLPGSGVYTAAIGSYVLGVNTKQFMIATVIGVIIAAILVTIIVLSGHAAFEWVVT